MLGFYKELWLFGAVTPARRSDDPRLHLKMIALSSLDNFCFEKFPIYCFPGPPDVGVLQGAVAVWSCNSSQRSGRIRKKVAYEKPQYFVGIIRVFICLKTLNLHSDIK